MELELILSDLAVVEKRLERLEKDIKKQKNPALEKELQVLTVCKAALDKQTPLREVDLGAEESKVIRGFTFLSLKPMLYVLNLGKRDAARANLAEQFAAEAGLKQRLRTAVSAICGKVEAELAELSEADAAEFMASYGLKESAISRLIHAGYQLLGLISFFTVGEDECRAWTIRAGIDGAGGRGRDPLRHPARLHPRRGDKVRRFDGDRELCRSPQSRPPASGRQRVRRARRRDRALPACILRRKLSVFSHQPSVISSQSGTAAQPSAQIGREPYHGR